MTTASKAQYKQNLKKFRQALSGKYKVNPTTQSAYVVGDGHIKIDGHYYDATTSGIAGTTAKVVNIGRPAAAIYSTAEGGTVVSTGGGSGSSSGGGGTSTDTATIEALKASAYVVLALNGTLTNERVLTVAPPINLSDGGGNNAVLLSIAEPPTLSVSSVNTAATGSHAITASSAPGAATSLLKSDTDGSLTLPIFIATTRVRSQLIDTFSGDLTFSPASGNAILNNNLTAGGTIQAANLIGTTKVRTPLIDTASGNLSIAPAGGTTAITGALTVSTTATVTTSVQTPLLTTASNVDLVINPAGTGAVQFPNDQTLRTSSFDSSFPINGWQINEVSGISGYSALTIGKIQADELAVRVFVADEVRVDRGDEYWTKSYGILEEAFTTPASISGTVSLTFEDSAALTGAIASNNDWVLFRSADIDTGINTNTSWGQLSGYADNGNGTQTWTFTLRSGNASTTFLKGNLGTIFGATGAALIHLSVIDAAGAPYIKMRKWVTNPYTPSNYTTYVQLGNLGSIGNSYYTPAGYGIYIRSTAAEDQFIVADDNGIQIRGADFLAYNGADQTVLISSADGSVKLGEDVSSDATTYFHFNGTDGTLRVAGDFSASAGEVQANGYGLNIFANDNTPAGGTDYAPGIKFTTDTSTPDRTTVVGHLIGEQYNGSPSSYNRLTIRTESGTATGVPSASIHIFANDSDSAFGTASIQLRTADAGPNSVKIFSQAANGASTEIGLYGNTVTYDVGPDADDTHDIGDAAHRYANAYIKNLHIDTIVGTPSYAHSHAAGDITSGTLDLARIPNTLTGKDADTLDSYHASSFSLTSHHHDSDYVGGISEGSGISVTGTIANYTISHADTSSASSVNGSLGVVVQDVTLDGSGHVTALGTVDLDGRYALIGDLSGYVPVTRTVTAGAGLTGGGALSADITISHADTSSQATVTGSGTTFVYGMTFDTYGHVQTVTTSDIGTALDSRFVNITGDTMTGNLGLNADAAAGNAIHLVFLTNATSNAQWQIIGRAHDYATSGEQNDLIVNWFNGTSSSVAMHIDNLTLATAFGGPLSVVANTDANNTFGRAIIGYAAASDSATFAHYDHNSSTNLALAQFSDGSTQINTVTGQEISLSVNDVATYSINADRLLPRSSVAVDIGDYNRKIRTIHAAELAVQTLVAQDVIATLGGQILVSDTSKLIADISSTGVVGGTDAISTNLVGYWSLDEVSGTRLDSKGTNHLTDKNTVTSTTGKVGVSAVFNSANSERLFKTDNATLSVGDIKFYLKMWVYATNDDGNVQCVVSKGGNAGNRAFELQLDWSDNRFEFTVYNSSDVSTTVNSGTVSINTWYLVEIWHSETANQIGIAINGTETTAAHTTGVKDETGNFTIGARNSGNYFIGRIDEVGFWKNYIPDATRRTFIYNSGSGRSYTDIYNYGAGAYTMDIEHNSYAAGDFLYMSAAPGGVPQIEVFKITSSATTITGGYRYSIERDLDGSGANNWYVGDTVTSLGGAVGEGYINLTATSTIHNHYGPTIAHYVRRGTGAWDSVAPVVVSGNLRSFVDYTTDEFGHAAGNDLLLTPEEGFKGYTIDTINGMRTFNVDISLYEEEVAFLKIGTSLGINIETNNVESSDNRSISFTRDGIVNSYLKGHKFSNINSFHIRVNPIAALASSMQLLSASPSGYDSTLQISATTGVTQSAIILQQGSVPFISLSTTGGISLSGSLISFNDDISMNSADIDMNGNDIFGIGSFGAWSNISFNTGWGNFGSGFQTGQYKKVGDLIILRGVVVRSSGSSATITTLSAGYRPAATQVLTASSNGAYARVDVETSGIVNLVVGSPTVWVSLDGLVFSTL